MTGHFVLNERMRVQVPLELPSMAKRILQEVDNLATSPNIWNENEPEVCYGQDKDGVWWIYLPNCGWGMIPTHRPEIHEDGTVSFLPSIVMWGHDSNGTPTTSHGFLTKGEWEEC
jgi:hypothetical protein